MARNRLYLDQYRNYEDETMLKQLLNPYKDQALDAVFGVEPEQGSIYDLGRSLLDSNYDPEGTFLSRALKDTPEVTNDFYDDEKGLDLEANLVEQTNDNNASSTSTKPLRRKASTFNVADTRTNTPLYEIPKQDVEEDEEKMRLINALRGF
tara:strand:- start:965 stop:1417 length:453 start_codon:yes stop_codon:yes gene_type:complete